MPDATMRINVQADSSRVTKLNKAIFNLHRQLQQATKHGKPLTAEHKRLQKMVLILEKALIKEGRAVDTLAIDYKRLNAITRHTLKVQRDVAASSLVVGKSLGRQNAAISNASFALQDFITVMQGGGGFERAVLSTTNNIGFMAAMLSNSLKGAIIGVGVAIGAAFIPMIIKMGKTWLSQKDMVGEFADFTLKKIEEVQAAGEKLLEDKELSPGVKAWERNLAGIDAALDHHAQSFVEWRKKTEIQIDDWALRTIKRNPLHLLLYSWKDFSRDAQTIITRATQGFKQGFGIWEKEEVKRLRLEEARQVASRVLTKKRIEDVEDYTESVRHNAFELKRIAAGKEFDDKYEQIRMLANESKTLDDTKRFRQMMIDIERKYNSEMDIIHQEEIDAQDALKTSIIDSLDDLHDRRKQYVDDQKELNDKLVSDWKDLEAELLNITQNEEERQKRELTNQIQSIMDRAAAVDMKGPLLVAALTALQTKIDNIGKPDVKEGAGGAPDAPPAEPDLSRGAALDALRTRQEERGPMSRSERRKHLAYWKEHGTLMPDWMMRPPQHQGPPELPIPTPRVTPPSLEGLPGHQALTPQQKRERLDVSYHPDLIGMPPALVPPHTVKDPAVRKFHEDQAAAKTKPEEDEVGFPSGVSGGMARPPKKGVGGGQRGQTWDAPSLAPLLRPPSAIHGGKYDTYWLPPGSPGKLPQHRQTMQDISGLGRNIQDTILSILGITTQSQADNNQAIYNLQNQLDKEKQAQTANGKVAKNLARTTKKARTR
jgi:hypothetical protein